MSFTKNITSNLEKMALKNQRVFLRADLNVPLNKDGSIISNHRLAELLPTLQLISDMGGHIILATHIGRPTGPDAALSTRNLIPWFTQHGYSVVFEPDLNAAVAKSKQLQKNEILLLENLRFFPGEQNNDPAFARQLATLGDYYVNDAFALLHRNDTSITLLPKFFPPEKRTLGPLIIHEISMLNKLLSSPKKPFVLVIGGGKVHDKISLITNLLPLVDTILLCPAIVFTFLRALGKPVGKSLVDDASMPLCTEIMQHAAEKNVRLVFPSDYIVADGSFNGPLSAIDGTIFPDNAVGITLGKKSIGEYSKIIADAGTVFYNGAMGTTARPETLSGMQGILQAMADCAGLSIVCGGDSVASAQMLGLDDKISHLSTGGGATLAYLSGESLPGLHIFLQQ